MNTKKLKQLVLDLAIHGKLVPQDPNDEPASELLKRIKEEKAKSDKRKKTSISSDNLDEVPFEVPSGWVWCHSGDIAYIASGSTPSKESFVEDGIPYLKMYNLRNQKIDFNFHPQYIKPEIHNGKLARSRTKVGDIIMNIVGPPLGKLAIIPESLSEANFNQAAVLIRPLLEKDTIANYIFYYLSEMSEIKSITTKGTAGQENISLTQSQHLRIPLPPLSEQKRIVSAIEKWFAVIDQIESNEADLRKSIEQTKKKVLDLAIHGKLVEQDENDEPASELLKRIKENHYICKKDDELFDIPSSWIWAKISDVGDLSRGKGFLKSDFVEDGYPCIHYGQIHMKFGLSTKKELTYIPESVAMKSGIAHPNDVIIAITSEDELCSCKSTAWLGDYDVAVGSHAAIYHHKINPMYVSFFLASKCFYDQKILYTHGSKVIEIRPADIGNCYIPLPPLSEQKRIVAKVEEVMGELDKTVEMMG